MKNKTDSRFLFIDTETGGTIPTKHSLLSIGMVVWDACLGEIARKEIFIKYPRYFVTKEAQRINKFDRNNQNNIGIEPKMAVNELLYFIKNHFPEDLYVTIIGHNVHFDIDFLKILFKKCGRSFEKYFSHRYIDTYSVFKTLVLAGILNRDLNSSADAFKYFNIDVEKRHDALDDCIATVELYEKMISLISKNNWH